MTARGFKVALSVGSSCTFCKTSVGITESVLIIYFLKLFLDTVILVQVLKLKTLYIITMRLYNQPINSFVSSDVLSWLPH